MAINKDDLTIKELKAYVEHLERVLIHYNPAEVRCLTTTDFKKACAITWGA